MLATKEIMRRFWEQYPLCVWFQPVTDSNLQKTLANQLENTGLCDWGLSWPSGATVSQIIKQGILSNQFVQLFM